MDRDWRERGEMKRENKEEERKEREGEGRWGSKSRRERLDHRNGWGRNIFYKSASCKVNVYKHNSFSVAMLL